MSKRPETFPFLFVGQGYGTSYKCLECFLWFAKKPSARQQARIRAALPRPLTSFARFTGQILHFGSDDALELYVKAAYEPPHAAKPFAQAVRDVTAIAEAKDFSEDVVFPATKYWKAFCADFERAVLAIHKIAKLELALKPDDDHVTPGPWHRWSVFESHRLAATALASRRKPSEALTYLSINLLEAFDDAMIRRLTQDTRKLWLAWIDALRRAAPRDLRGEYDDRALPFLEAVGERERQELLASLSPSLRRALEDQLE